jgi:hypothetical protein
MKQPPKIYAPVTDFERATSYCPLYLAWRILHRQIDTLVYDLYALTPAEIKIVEGMMK